MSRFDDAIDRGYDEAPEPRSRWSTRQPGCETCKWGYYPNCPCCTEEPTCACGSTDLWERLFDTDEEPICVECAREAGKCCKRDGCEARTENDGDDFCRDHDPRFAECEAAS